MKWPLEHDIPAMHATFGNPDANGDGAPDPAWLRTYLTTITPPYPMFFATRPVKLITCNKAISTPLLTALQKIAAHFTRDQIVQLHLDQFGGVFNFRSKRLGGRLSVHAYAAAIDLDPAHNPQGKGRGAMPQDVVAIFEEQGAEWGGHWSTKYQDPMHFQWARTH